MPRNLSRSIRASLNVLVGRARSFVCDDVRVGAGEVDRFVCVDPSHSVADGAGALDDFEDLTLARKLSGLACVNDDRVSGLCVHRHPPVDVTVPADSARDVRHAPGVDASESVEAHAKLARNLVKLAPFDAGVTDRSRTTGVWPGRAKRSGSTP